MLSQVGAEYLGDPNHHRSWGVDHYMEKGEESQIDTSPNSQERAFSLSAINGVGLHLAKYSELFPHEKVQSSELKYSVKECQCCSLVLKEPKEVLEPKHMGDALIDSISRHIEKAEEGLSKLAEWHSIDDSDVKVGYSSTLGYIIGPGVFLIGVFWRFFDWKKFQV